MCMQPAAITRTASAALRTSETEYLRGQFFSPQTPFGSLCIMYSDSGICTGTILRG